MMRFNAIKLAGLAAGMVAVSLGTAAMAQVPVAGDTFVADTTNPYSFTGTSQSISGNIVLAVFRNTGGTYDFIYQFTVTGGSAPAGGISVSDFSGVSATVSQESYAANLPNGVTFLTSGAGYTSEFTSSGTIYFIFGTPVSSGNSLTLLVQTNSTSYAPNNSDILGAAGGNTPILAANGIPSPEPGVLALIVPGLLGVGGMIRRRKAA